MFSYIHIYWYVSFQPTIATALKQLGATDNESDSITNFLCFGAFDRFTSSNFITS